MGSKPTFVFVHGAWHSADFFDTIKSRLAQDGYSSIACVLPSVGTLPPVESMEPDVASVRDVVSKLLAEGRDVICVAHSYGGTVLTEAIGTLAQSDGHESKLDGGNNAKIRRLVYVAAMVPQVGERQIDVGKDAQVEKPPVYYRWENGIAYVEPNVVNVFYHDESPEVGAGLVAKLRPQAIASVMSPVTACGWRYIPSTYIFTTKDIALPIATQRFIVENVRQAAKADGSGIQPFDEPLGEASIDCGHCAPFVSKAKEMAEILIRCVQGV
ncbi:Alpha/beta hydrolase fold-1 [Xylogone sp. PMI_703]|nr:Alpha/beta hydrolase fold-1 [Xylogone sp. PMI_703]